MNPNPLKAPSRLTPDSHQRGRDKLSRIPVRVQSQDQPARKPAGADRPVMTFETLTLAPIDRRLIAVELLSDAERDWIDAYHARVSLEIAGKLDDVDRRWLEAACAPL